MRMGLWVVVALLCADVGAEQLRLRMAPSGLAGLPLLTETMALGGRDGGFCAPDTASGGRYISFGPTGGLALNAAGTTMFVQGGAGNSYNIAEVTIPAVVDTSNPASMNTGTFAQTTGGDPSENQYNEAFTPNSYEGTFKGKLVYDGSLILTWFLSYDANGTMAAPYMKRSTNLTSTGSVVGFTGFSNLGSAVGVYTHRMQAAGLTLIPAQWQAALGGSTVLASAGASGSIISNQSYGPSAFGINPDNIGGTGNAQPFVFYNAANQTLGGYNAWAAGEEFEIATNVQGAVIIEGTRTALFFGAMGTAETECYGPGLGDPKDPLIGTPYPDPVTGPHTYCYDPTSSDEGQHAYPYAYRVWAYDVLDFQRVVDGTAEPWAIEPYALWTLTFPVVSTGPFKLQGIAYDATNRYLYIAQRADTGGCTGSQGVIWRYTVDITP